MIPQGCTRDPSRRKRRSIAAEVALQPAWLFAGWWGECDTNDHRPCQQIASCAHGSDGANIVVQSLQR
jgi:hypothetical protein